MSIDVFAADEQGDHPIEVARWAELSRKVLAARGVKGETEVSLLFVDEDAIAALNEQFLGKSGPTDVLSFPIEDEPGPTGRSPDLGGSGPGSLPARRERSTLLGDVVICPAVAARNAVEHEVSLEDEVALLVVHGLLHLLGMDHEDDAEAERMEALEQELLDPLLPEPGARGVDRHRRLPRRGRRPPRRHRRPAGGVGPAGAGRDQPGAHEPDQGEVAGRREATGRPAAGAPGRAAGQVPQPDPARWCSSASWCRPPWSAWWPSTSSAASACWSAPPSKWS